jgi:uncharacterized coiled-coil DUF342 family protein
MEFNNFISKLFNGYPQSQKLESPLNDPFYYDEFGTIKEYEQVRELAREQIKGVEERKKIVAKIHLAEPPITEEQKRIARLESHITELESRIAWQDFHSINQHIQVSKTIVGLSKILRPIVFALPDTKEAKRIVKLAEKYMPLLNSIDQKFDKYADQRNESKEELK